MSKANNWKDKAKTAFEHYLNELEQDLPPGSSINEIEQKLWNSHKPFLQQILQARADSESLSWPHSSTSRAWAAFFQKD